MISERKKLVLWPLVEEFTGINPLTCGTRKRDQVEHFLTQISEILETNSEELKSDIVDLKRIVREFECKIEEMEEF